MSFIGAFIGGFASFFSIWVFCLMQVVPFFVALMVASSLSQNSVGQVSCTGCAGVKKAVATGCVALLGFILVFMATGMSGTSISHAVFTYSGMLNQIGGVVIGLVGLFFVGLLTVKEAYSPAFGVAKVVSVFLFGAALGLAYKPCVTPTLTKIYNINTAPGNVVTGGGLLFFYALGISVAILLAGALLSRIAVMIKPELARLGIKKLLGVVILVVAGLILTDKMTLYKSFLVERFVTIPMEGHGNMAHDGATDKSGHKMPSHSGQGADEHMHMEKHDQ
ncbi:hypothetical protein MNBD_NITROSPINAE01-1500 [hydrothermal vent metagenome]|uniref:Uncharacterized protein n=1 Tax=hydrothermal vent metagenome TaxID=652676 RepID=A0A3B1CBJ9_9ZZZZ